MSFITGLFKKNASAVTPAAGINVQSSIYGKPIPLLYGRTRCAGNLIIYGNFTATQVSSGAGGKGSWFGSSSNQGTAYDYHATFAFALCEGPINNINLVWRGTAINTLAGWGMALFSGAFGQAAWSYPITWQIVDENGTVITSGGQIVQLGYSGIAYVAAPNIDLKSSTALPNYQFEVYGLKFGSGNASGDADPTVVLADFLTNANHGLGFPSSLLGSFTVWQNYCFATGLFISPAYTTQRTGSDMIDELMVATNSACFFSSGKFQVAPYGDTALTGNGKTYTPSTTPIYALTDDDFQANPQNNSGASAAGGSGPVLLTRKRKSDTINSIKIEYLNRPQNYNPSVTYANSQAEIDTFGLRTNGSKQLHLFALSTAANLSANLQLRREAVVNTYRFDLDQRYILLDPMDVISITDSNLGISNLLVRITEIDENDDGTLSFICEEYMQGTGSAPSYSFANDEGQPFSNTEAPPGVMNTPVFFEPPFELNQALEVYCAVSGDSNWGGADVWTSSDGINYTFQQTISGSCRMGTLTAPLATFTESVTGQTIDQTNTLAVLLQQGALTTASPSEAQKLSTLCYVDGELISYANATLTGALAYNITYLVRGAFNSPISSHSTNANFIRLDLGILKIPFTQDRIGQTISIKFLSFNQYGGGKQTLGAVSPVNYTIQGTALAEPLANVADLAVAYIGNLSEVRWTEITDFRPILYEIRLGPSFDGAGFVTRVAHPPWRTQGTGTYWFAAYTQPVPGLVVYSATPQSITISNANITANVAASREEDPTWSGTISGNVVIVGATVQTTGTGGGTYTIPIADRITITYPFACAVIMKWTSSASPLNNSIFDYSVGASSLVSGSTIVTGVKIFTGNGRLYGTALIDNLASTFLMGPGQPLTGTGIPSGATILAVLSTTSLSMTLNATTGSTVTASTQAVTVFPFLAPGLDVQATSTTIIPAGAQIASTSSTDYGTFFLTTAGAPLITTSTSLLNISIDFLNAGDLYGAAAAANAAVYPQVRVSTDGGITFSSWQNWQAGYYLGNVFDAQMVLKTDTVQSIGVLETWNFSLDVPNRTDHFSAFSVSSLGSTVFFRPDGGTTAAFNGGNGGTTKPTVTPTIASGNPARTAIAGPITLSAATIFCYSSTAGAVADTVHIVAMGY